MEKQNLNENSLTFSTFGAEVIRFDPDGKIFIQGRLAESDKEVVDAFRSFLRDQGYLK